MIPAVIAAVTGAAAVFLAAEIYRELHTFKVTRYKIETDRFKSGEKEIRLVFLSDLHNRVYGRNNERLYQAVRNENPDLILIGGDMLVGKENVSYEPALSFVAELPEICPVYYANGNHEQRMKEEPEQYIYSYSDYKSRLEGAGVIFLENECRTVRINGRELELTELELPMETYRKLKRSSVEAGDIAALTGRSIRDTGREESPYSILLAHNPCYMDAYTKWGADLILSGHLHGGIVRLPGIGGIISPQITLFPRYSGELSQEGAHTIIVSRGLGTHTINLRLFNTPELVSVCIVPDRSPEKKTL